MPAVSRPGGATVEAFSPDAHKPAAARPGAPPTAAYDRGILGVRRDYVVEVRPDVLLEVDGPMLRHGIQDVQSWTLELPKRLSERPDQDLLEQRWLAFAQR